MTAQKIDPKNIPDAVMRVTDRGNHVWHRKPDGWCFNKHCAPEPRSHRSLEWLDANYGPLLDATAGAS